LVKKEDELLERRTISISKVAAIASGQFVKEREYWLNKFSGDLIKSYFPYDYNKIKTTDSLAVKENSVTTSFSGNLFSGLMRLSRGFDYTLHIIALAVVVVLLDKYTYNGNKDIIIGIPIYKQEINADMEFVNTVLALRVQPEEHLTFKELLLQVRQTILEADENKNYPIEVLISQLNMSMSEYDCPLFDVAVLLENIHDIGYLHPVNLNMIFCFRRTGESIEMEVQYNASRYQRATVEGIALHFTCLLQQVLLSVELRLTDIDMTTEEEKKQLIKDFNDTTVEYPRDKTIHELFEEQAARTPNGVAVICAGCIVEAKGTVPFNDIYLTYRELNEKSGQLAVVLREKGVLADNIVAIMMERSIEMIIAILGILKVGCAYLPIEPDYPEERKQYMIADSGSRILLTNLSEVHQFNHSSCQFIIHNTSNLAYVIYTSGTTGRPKGVMVEQRNVVRLVKNTNYIEFKEGDRILQTGALEFDASTFEIWGALLNGLVLCLLEKENILSPEALKTSILLYKITTLWLTSPLFNQVSTMDIEIFKGLKNLLVGGDVLSPFHINMVRKRFPRLTVINGYGPTENTTFSTTYLIDKEYNASIPIGKPITNSTAYIVDRYGHLQPPGAVGELVVGGDGVARGYLNNPELMAEKFDQDLWDFQDYHDEKKKDNEKFLGVQGPFFKKVPGRRRLYKTGDLARWLPDGNIEFLGRIDHQVKLRGFRVELPEIERQLENHQAVEGAVVVVRENKNGDKQLCAYVVYGEPTEFTGLREFLAKTLPEYMIPGCFVTLDKIPLTANGKVDRKSLPEPEVDVSCEYIAPRDEVEKNLVEIWKEVLGWTDDTSIGIEDNFFDLGGDSLKATILTAKIYREFQVRITLGQIFQIPTIIGISGFIKKTGRSRFIGVTPVEEKEYYPLSSAQRQFFVMQQLDPNTTTYNIFLQRALEDTVEKEILEDIVSRLIQRHETLRTSFEIVNGEPVQRVHRHIELKIEYYNFPTESIENIIFHFIRPFDLSWAPLLRAGLIRLEENKSIFIVDMHHILSDFLSQEVLVNDVLALYSGVSLPGLRLQYRDYAHWQNRQAMSGEIKKQEEYWLNEFGGDIPVLEIPTDFPRPKVKSFEGSIINFELDRGVALRLANLARRENATLFMLYLVVVCILLNKLSGREDIIIGTIVAGRRHPDLENIIGAFINTLTLRNYPREDKTFRQFLREVRKRTLEAFDNQDYRFEDLVKKVMIDRDTSRNPLFDILYSFAASDRGVPADTETSRETNQYNPNLRGEPYGGGEAGNARFDITIAGGGAGDQCGFFFEYSTRLFKKETMQRYISYFKEIAAIAAKNADILLKDIIVSTDLNVVAADVYDEQSEFDF
jgi:amino acid adenylation domain-containing protein